MNTINRTATYTDIISSLETYAKNNNNGDIPLLFFSGEFDSNQTTFESNSNNLKIGVIARNLPTAQVLLRLVRIIIDHNSCLFNVPFEEDEGLTLTFEKYVNYFRENDNYIVSFPITDTFTKELTSANGNYQVQSTIDTVDVWTIPRIFSAIRDMFELNQA